MADLPRSFQRALGKFGEPVGGEAAPSSVLQAYHGCLPDGLLQFWERYGFGVWLDGYFQFCNPDAYHQVIQAILGNDPQLKAEESHVIGFSAFGRLLVWNEDYRVTRIDTLYHRVLCDELFSPAPNIDDDIAIGISIANANAGANDPPDQDGKPLFERVRKASGPLSYGQIYAPRLHPALGGPIVVEAFRPVSAFEALLIAAQTGPFVLYDASTPQVRAVRAIG
ncbi:GAD-like domain-containing protein [Inquilinus limosus]|uniref:GAD-like domain-containing protein n=1 Tax=Inquilinus limosus TaxID=171674 RepID=UPI00047D65A5|nr:GAD-like domain-containing protein [Inquilinus limosus]